MFFGTAGSSPAFSVYRRHRLGGGHPGGPGQVRQPPTPLKQKSSIFLIFSVLTEYIVLLLVETLSDPQFELLFHHFLLFILYLNVRKIKCIHSMNCF